MSKSKKDGLLLDWEAADRITILNLKLSAKMISKDIKFLEKLIEQGGIADCQQKDYLSNITHLRAITTILEYFGEK